MTDERTTALGFPRCAFSFADGRRCALPATPHSRGLCYAHAHAPHRRLRPSDLTRELASPTGTPSAAKIRRFLGKLPRAAEGVISHQDVGILTQLCNLMLQCERHAKDRNFPEPIGDEWAFVSAMLNDDEDNKTNHDERMAALPPRR